MAFYIRKSYKFGPIRMNLSKSGVGFSVGVKGARIGINSRGQRYIAGGRHGLYFRKNLGSEMSKASSPATSVPGAKLPESYESAGSHNSLPDTNLPYEKWVPWVLSFLFFILSLSAHWVFFPAGIVVFLAFAIFQLDRKKKFEDWHRLLEGEWNPDTIEKIQKSSAELSKNVEIYNNHLYYFLDRLITRIAEDKKLDESEKKVIQILFENSLDTKKKEKIRQLLGLIAVEFTLDHTLSNEEKDFLNTALDLFGIEGESRKAFEDLIQYFDKLDSIRNADKLEPIQPSVRIESPGESIYFEADIKVLNPKNRSVQETWKLFLSDSQIHILGQGHRKIRWEDILYIDIADPFSDVLEITVRNRKTPLSISCKNAILVYTLIRKLQSSS